MYAEISNANGFTTEILENKIIHNELCVSLELALPHCLQM